MVRSGDVNDQKKGEDCEKCRALLLSRLALVFSTLVHVTVSTSDFDYHDLQCANYSEANGLTRPER